MHSDLIRDYQNTTLSVIELSKKYGLTKQGVHYIIKRYKVERSEVFWKRLFENIPSILAEINSMSLHAIGEKYSLPLEIIKVKKLRKEAKEISKLYKEMRREAIRNDYLAGMKYKDLMIKYDRTLKPIQIAIEGLTGKRKTGPK